MDRRLLDVLACPVTKQALKPLSAAQLAVLNRAIRAGGVVSVDGNAWSETLGAGLIRQDGKVLYAIRDGIPVLLPDKGIGTTQFTDFPPQ
jgi:uncharacterized protein YbaR (Trm112 family)